MTADDKVGGQMELISETLRLRAEGVADFTPHGLLFRPDVSEADLLIVGRRLFAVRSYVKWAMGSVFAAMVRVREARREASARARKDEKNGTEWAGEFAAAHQLDPKEYREMIGVFTFYRVGTDSGEKALRELGSLSFEHYREAMWAVDDGQPQQLERAIAHLRHARDQRWTTVAPLRRYIRSSSATQTVEPTQPELAAYGAVFEFMRWAKRELDRVESYTPERAALILSDLGDSTLSYIDALRDIAKGADPKRIALARKKREGKV